jgi:sugar-specific transcriptional regulator TrmB
MITLLNMQKEQVLRDIGLNDNEVKVYLELLKLGQSKVNIISSRLNIPRTTVYTVLNSLIKKGFSNYVIKSGVKYFDPLEPKKLVNFLDEKRDYLKEAIPELESIKKTIINKPFVEIYEGKEGLKTIMEDIINSKPKEHLILTTYKIFSLMEYSFPNFIKRKEKIKPKIETRILGPNQKNASKFIKRYKNKYRKIKILSDNLNINFRMEIYNNKTIITNMEQDNLISIFIKDSKISDSFKAVFNMLWVFSKQS